MGCNPLPPAPELSASCLIRAQESGNRTQGDKVTWLRKNIRESGYQDIRWQKSDEGSMPNVKKFACIRVVVYHSRRFAF